VTKDFRFLDVPYFSPTQNMALDEALMQNFASNTTPIFRLYTWEKNAFSIGRFQNISKIDDFDSFGNNFTRRVTGGGLLLHGFDVSYSLIIPSSKLANKSVKQGYEFLCSFLYTFYSQLGLKIDFAKDILNEKLSSSVFCQVGFEPYDIVVQGKKIGGNAQKRSKNLIYQHGSIPLHVDSRPFSGTSLEALGIKLDIQKTKELLKQAFQSTFGITLTSSKLTDQELVDFEFLHVNKYITKEWKYESITTKP
jgi:lipoyl(octanoyl) transferase